MNLLKRRRKKGNVLLFRNSFTECWKKAVADTLLPDEVNCLKYYLL